MIPSLRSPETVAPSSFQFMNSFRWIRAGLVFAIVLCVGWMPASAKDKKGSAKAAKQDAEEYTALFSNGPILKLKLILSTNAVERLEKVEGGFGTSATRENVVGTVQEGDRVYHGVQVHLKGAAGSFRPIHDKPAFTLAFDKYVKSQRFHGLRKLSLNNSVQDPTFLSEQLCRELFLEAGVPVPRATQVKLEVNGRDLGMYVLVEGWDRDFVSRHFSDPSGTLYDGGFLKDVTETLAVNVGNEKSDQADRKQLVAALDEPDPTKKLEALRKILDVDRFLSMMAMEVIVWDWDGYPMNRNNWRLYSEPASGKLTLMPHGMDQMFWKPDGGILPRMQGRIAQEVMKHPELRRAYIERLRSLRTRVFDVARITNRVQLIADRIQAELVNGKHAESAGYPALIAALKTSIARRGESLDRQLEHPIEPAVFGTNGLATLGAWKPKTTFGAATFDPTNAPQSGRTVRIAATDGSCIGGWNTGLWLEQGRYALQGRVKVRGVEPDPGDSRGGAGLQVLEGRVEKPILGTSDWQPIELEFSVEDGLAEIPISLQLRAADGEAWFDLDSFRVRKLAAQVEPPRGPRGPRR